MEHKIMVDPTITPDTDIELAEAKKSFIKDIDEIESALAHAVRLNPELSDLVAIKRQVLNEIDKALETLIIHNRINPRHLTINHFSVSDYSIYEIVKIQRLGMTLVTLVVRADEEHGAVVEVTYNRR